ncbi:MAG: hypothetical protein OWT28_04775, partial [Firmicutes bacterium]|nr:hypothetical protein [Bacillota bacterium]
MKKDRNRDEPERPSRGGSSRADDPRDSRNRLPDAAGKHPGNNRVKGDYSGIKASNDPGKFGLGAGSTRGGKGDAPLPDKAPPRPVSSERQVPKQGVEAAGAGKRPARAPVGAASASATPAAGKKASPITQDKPRKAQAGNKNARPRTKAEKPRRRRSVARRVIG